MAAPPAQVLLVSTPEQIRDLEAGLLQGRWPMDEDVRLCLLQWLYRWQAAPAGSSWPQVLGEEAAVMEPSPAFQRRWREMAQAWSQAADRTLQHAAQVCACADQVFRRVQIVCPITDR